MLIHTRKLLLSLVLGGACATTASAQEQFNEKFNPPPIGGIEEGIPATPAIESAPADIATPTIEATPIVESTPATTVLAPIPDDGTATIRVSDCPQNADGASQRRKHLPPTAGWVAPGRIATARTWVPYWKFYPNNWTGQPVGPQVRLPVIYTPTDTTQLGYYYQHVPHWHSYANMIPPVPRPVDWHYKYQMPGQPRMIYRMAPQEDLGQPQPMPTPANEPAAPPPPSQNLDKSATAPELLPLMR
ncbi:MAG: hypothetical protein U0992_08040 [Planctomycetaceae bacterium]